MSIFSCSKKEAYIDQTQWALLKIQGDFGCGGRVNGTIKPFCGVPITSENNKS